MLGVESPEPNYGGLLLDELPSPAWYPQTATAAELDTAGLLSNGEGDNPYISHPIVWFEPHLMDDDDEEKTPAKSGQYFYYDGEFHL